MLVVLYHAKSLGYCSILALHTAIGPRVIAACHMSGYFVNYTGCITKLNSSFYQFIIIYVFWSNFTAQQMQYQLLIYIQSSYVFIHCVDYKWCGS